MTRQPMTERNNDILEAVRNGSTYEQAAETHGLRAATVQAIVREGDRELYNSLLKPRGRKAETTPSERTQEIIRTAVENTEMSLSEIGEKFDVTGERVRQLAVRFDPEGYAERRRIMKEASALRAAEREAAKQKDPFNCVVCGITVTDTRRQRYCSDDHHQIYTQTFRYHIDEEYHQKHKQYVADWMLNNEQGSLVHAQNVRNGTAQTRGRWFTKGSKAFSIAIEAYKNNWPVFEQLPDQLQDQVRREVHGDQADE